MSVQLKRYTFMHNGGITGFPQMKRYLLSQLGDEAYEAMEGTTDSEVCHGFCSIVVSSIPACSPLFILIYQIFTRTSIGRSTVKLVRGPWLTFFLIYTDLSDYIWVIGISGNMEIVPTIRVKIVEIPHQGSVCHVVQVLYMLSGQASYPLGWKTRGWPGHLGFHWDWVFLCRNVFFPRGFFSLTVRVPFYVFRLLVWSET